MTRCTLTNEHARKTVATVWRHLRQHFRADARFLAAVVRRIEPLTEDETSDGTMGLWSPEYFTHDEQTAFYERFGDGRGECYGSMKLLDSDALGAEHVAHEMGHAITTMEDLCEREAPSREWESEAAADMHAVRWGLITAEGLRRRHANNLAALRETDVTGDNACLHHGPPPGGDWLEIYGKRWRLREEDFVFEKEPE